MKWGKYPPFGVLVNNTSRCFTHSLPFYLPLGGLLTNLVKYPKLGAFVNTGSFLNKNFKDFSGLSRAHFPFKDPFSATKSLKSMSFSVLLQEQFYPEGLSVLLGWIKLEPKVKDFPGPTANFKDFQGLEFLFSNSKSFKVRANPVNRKLSLEVAVTDQDKSGTEYRGNRV